MATGVISDDLAVVGVQFLVEFSMLKICGVRYPTPLFAKEQL